MPSRRTATLATLLALALSAALAGPALAVPVAIPGAPLTVYVDELGQLQAKRDNSDKNIFYKEDKTTGDAGFFLAFPDPVRRHGPERQGLRVHPHGRRRRDVRGL